MSSVVALNRTNPLFLRGLYTTMLRIRRTEECVAELVEKGEIRCPCHLCIGQEAIATGVCAVLRTDDYVFGGHRSHGHYLAKGGSLKEMMAELFGKSTGCARGRGGSMHLVAPEVGILGTVPIVAATIPMAVGTGLASKLRKDGRVSVSFFGDGAVDEGTFHESMNLAATWILPVVFVCENNLYSSHLHLLERRGSNGALKTTSSRAPTCMACRESASMGTMPPKCTGRPPKPFSAPEAATDRLSSNAGLTAGAGTLALPTIFIFPSAGRMKPRSGAEKIRSCV